VIRIDSEEDVSEWQDFVSGRTAASESRGFCPTGPGGGIDNSCSSKDGGGGSDAAVGDPLKRKDIAVGQTISIQKYGQNAVHNGVVTKVKHDDKSSEITIKDSDGNEKTVKIRDLAKIREANLGDTGKVSEPKAPKGSGKKKYEGPPEPPESVSKKARAEYRAAVEDYCKSLGVEYRESIAMGRAGTTMESMKEVAQGLHRLRQNGMELPESVVMTTKLPSGRSMGSTLGYYVPGGKSIYIHGRLSTGEPEASIKSGWLAGSAASQRGTTVMHEMGHMAHERAVGSKAFNALPRPDAKTDTTLSFRDHETAGRVSRYAQKSPTEFVAETYTGHLSGQRYTQEVYDLYNRFGGPRLPGTKKRKVRT